MKRATSLFFAGLGLLLTCLLTACDQQQATNNTASTAALSVQQSANTKALATADTVTATSSLQTDAEKFSYMLGVQLASRVPKNVLALDTAALSRGIDDSLNGKALKISHSEMQKLLHQYTLLLKEHEAQQQQELQLQHGIRKQQLDESGKHFLAQNRLKPGVTETPEGVQYLVLQAGQGKRPTMDDTVRVHYSVSFVDQDKLVEFDSSYSRQAPVTYPLREVIPGWRLILPLMQEGAHYRVVVPASKAYGKPGITGGEIPETATLVYDMELLEVLGGTEAAQ